MNNSLMEAHLIRIPKGYWVPIKVFFISFGNISIFCLQLGQMPLDSVVKLISIFGNYNITNKHSFVA